MRGDSMRNPKSKYYQTQSKSQIPISKSQLFDNIGLCKFVVLVGSIGNIWISADYEGGVKHD